MAASGTQNSWDIIQQGVRDTERLIGQKQYNLSMVKARQTLEYMVNLLAEKTGIIDGDLIDIIDSLYQGRLITKSTCEHYHKIRMIGNKAVHEGSDNAYDANQAYHLLSQEVYVFANEYASNRSPGSRTSGGSGNSRGTSSRSSGSRSSGTRSSGSRSGSSRSSGSRSSSGSAANRSRRRAKQRKQGISSYDLLKLLVPVLCIILLIVLIRLIKPSNQPKKETTAPPVTTEAPVDSTIASTEPPTEAMTPTEQPTIVYRSTANLNVRPEPNTNQAAIAFLSPGSEVDVIGKYDDEWYKINYNGQEAYVASQFVTTE